MADSIEKVKRIKQRHENIWLNIKGVVAVGIGNTAGGNVGVIVSVKENAAAIREKIPESIEGVPIAIQETGEIKALRMTTKK